MNHSANEKPRLSTFPIGPSQARSCNYLVELSILIKSSVFEIKYFTNGSNKLLFLSHYSPLRPNYLHRVGKSEFSVMNPPLKCSKTFTTMSLLVTCFLFSIIHFCH